MNEKGETTMKVKVYDKNGELNVTLDSADLEQMECSSYDEGKSDEHTFYMNERKCEIGNVGYLYDKAGDRFYKLKIVKTICRSDNAERYDNYSSDILVDNEDTYGADTSAEFITEHDCYLVWFVYA